MIHLVYVSSATNELNEQQLLDLLEHARDRNRRHNITGMLLYAGGNFLQVLEGEQTNVDKIYKAIKNDERNSGNLIICREHIEERSFSEWSMGFKHLTSRNPETIDGYSRFLDTTQKPDGFTSNSDEVVALLRLFRSGNPG